MVVHSTAAGREVPLDLFAFYRRRLHLASVNTGIVDAEAGARILGELAPLFERGALAPYAAIERHALPAAAAAYARVAGGFVAPCSLACRVRPWCSRRPRDSSRPS